MSNPYQPAKLIDEGLRQGESKDSRFCTWMGMLAAILATPLSALLVLAAGLMMIRMSGLQSDFGAMAGDKLFQSGLIIGAVVAVVLSGLSAYLAIRSAIHYFAEERQKGGIYLFASLVTSSLILVFLLLDVMLHTALQ